MNKEAKIFLATTAAAVGLGGALITDKGFASQDNNGGEKAQEPRKTLVLESKPQIQPELQINSIEITGNESKPELAPGLVRIPAGSKINTSFWQDAAKQMVYGEGRPSIVSGHYKIISAPYFGAIYQDLNDGSLYATQISDRPDYIVPDSPVNAWGWNLWQEGGRFRVKVTTIYTIEQWSSADGLNWSIDSSVNAPMPR